jgi:hypothetical protein
MHCMSVPRCGSLATVLTTLALPCLTYASIILIIRILSVVMKHESRANVEDAVAAHVCWTPYLHHSSYDLVFNLICLTDCNET